MTTFLLIIGAISLILLQPPLARWTGWRTHPHPKYVFPALSEEQWEDLLPRPPAERIIPSNPADQFYRKSTELLVRLKREQEEQKLAQQQVAMDVANFDRQMGLAWQQMNTNADRVNYLAMLGNQSPPAGMNYIDARTGERVWSPWEKENEEAVKGALGGFTEKSA